MVQVRLHLCSLLFVCALFAILSTCVQVANAEQSEEESAEISDMQKELENEYMERQAKKQQLPDFKKMRVKRLRELLTERGEDCSNCVEKEEFIERLKKVYHKPVLPEFIEPEEEEEEYLDISHIPEEVLAFLPRKTRKEFKKEFDKSDKENKVMIQTAMLLGGMESVEKCSACESALMELQLDMQEKLFRKTGDGKRHRWARIWNLYDKTKKSDLIGTSLDESICSAMDKYGHHTDSGWFVLSTLQVEGDINSNSTITKNLHSICHFILNNLKDQVVDKLSADEDLIKKQVTDKGLDLAENMMQVWAANRANVCEELMYTRSCKETLHPGNEKAKEMYEAKVGGKMDWEDMGQQSAGRKQAKDKHHQQKMDKKERRRGKAEL